MIKDGVITRDKSKAMKPIMRKKGSRGAETTIERKWDSSFNIELSGWEIFRYIIQGLEELKDGYEKGTRERKDVKKLLRRLRTIFYTS